MKKYIQPAIYVFGINMESALLSGSNLPEIGTTPEVEESEEYTNRQEWQQFDWTED